jgi:3-phenylpropionate/trans-cinnamate dioxygenase ferredoxin reductase component
LKNSPKEVIYYRTLSDFYTLKELTKEKNTFCVIGGGFIGSEITAALEKQDKEVTMIFPESGISSQIFPDDLAEFLNEYYQSRGTKLSINTW